MVLHVKFASIVNYCTSQQKNKQINKFAIYAGTRSPNIGNSMYGFKWAWTDSTRLESNRISAIFLRLFEHTHTHTQYGYSVHAKNHFDAYSRFFVCYHTPNQLAPFLLLFLHARWPSETNQRNYNRITNQSVWTMAFFYVVPSQRETQIALRKRMVSNTHTDTY